MLILYAAEAHNCLSKDICRESVEGLRFIPTANYTTLYTNLLPDLSPKMVLAWDSSDLYYFVTNLLSQIHLMEA